MLELLQLSRHWKCSRYCTRKQASAYLSDRYLNNHFETLYYVSLEFCVKLRIGHRYCAESGRGRRVKTFDVFRGERVDAAESVSAHSNYYTHELSRAIKSDDIRKVKDNTSTTEKPSKFYIKNCNFLFLFHLIRIVNFFLCHVTLFHI